MTYEQLLTEHPGGEGRTNSVEVGKTVTGELSKDVHHHDLSETPSSSVSEEDWAV